MAVDTREKRFSIMNMVSGAAIHQQTLFEADGTVDQDDRQHLLDGYSGINWANPSGVTILDFERGFRRGFSRGMARGMH